MKCSMGTAPAKLTVLPTRTVFLAGQPQANISDHKSIVNLGTFGLCRSLGYPATASATAAALGTLTPMPCMHNTPMPWMGGKMDTLIKGQPALLKSCTCQCMWGGVISLVNNGQTGQGAESVTETPMKKRSAGLSGKAQGQTQAQGQNPQRGGSAVQGTKSVSLKADAHFKEVLKEQPASWPEDLRKAKAQNIMDLEKALGVTKGAPMSIEDADRQSANPKYAEAEEYKVNCATCSAAYALRLLGFDVKAKGNVSGSDSLNEWLSYQHSFDIWKNADGTPAEPVLTAEWMKAQGEQKMTPELYKRYFEETCKEEGVYIVTLGWSGGGGHATILQRDSDGKLYYVEPQAYDEKKGERLGIDMLYNNLAETPSPKRGILRVDDKMFNTDYAALFDI